MAKIAIDTSPVLQEQPAIISENMEEDVDERSTSSSSSSIQGTFDPRDNAGANHHSNAYLGQVASYLPNSQTQGDVLSAAHVRGALGSASLLSLSALSISSEASSERGRQRKAEIFAASEQVIAAAKASKIAAMALDSKLAAKQGLANIPPTSSVQREGEKGQKREDGQEDAGEIQSVLLETPPPLSPLDAASQLGKEIVQRVDTGLIEIMMGRLQLERKQQSSLTHALKLSVKPNVKGFTEQSRPKEDKNQDGLSVDVPRQQKNYPIRSSISSNEEERPSVGMKEKEEEAVSIMLSNCRVHTTNSALRELIMTEESYCEDLYTLVHGFLKAIRDSNLISQEHKNLMIRNAFDIYNFQMDFQDAMLMALLIHHDQVVPDREHYFLEKIAQLFLDWAPKFRVYIDYCVNQDKAVEAQKECLQGGEAVVAFMERLHTLIRANRGCMSRLKLEDYLIMPVQRIFKYGLMLERLQKSAVHGTNIHNQLSMALDAMRKVSVSINETKTRMDTEKKTNLFLSRLEADWALSTRFYGLLGCSRLIGTLDVKIGNDGAKPKRLGCALFNSYVILARIKKHDKYEARHWFPLRMFALNDDCADETGNANSWMLYNERHRVEFIAMCDQERKLWTDAFRKSISQSTEEYEKRVKSQDVLEEVFLSSLEMPDNAPDSASYASFHSVLSRNESRHETPRTTTSYDRSDVLDSPTYHQTAPSSAVSGNSSNQLPSPGMRSIGSFGDLREIVTEFKQQRRYQPYNTRCAHIDSKFEEVCFTPILTARAQARNEYEAMKRKSRMGKSTSMLAFTQLSSSAVVEDTPAAAAGFASPRQPSTQGKHSSSSGLGNSLMTAVRRKSSMPGRLRVAEVHAHNRPVCSSPLHQQLPSRLPPTPAPPAAAAAPPLRVSTVEKKKEGLERSSSTTSETGGLPRSLSTATMGLARSSSRFIGRMVGRLGTIGTPQRTKRSTTVTTRLSDSTHSLASAKSEAFTTSSSSTITDKKKSKKHQSRKPPRLCIPTNNF